MSNYYVACDLSADSGRVMLATLHKERFTISEVRRFQNQPVREKGSLHWNIPQLYHETLEGLRSVGAYDEPIDAISCNSWGSDYLLFEANGTLITPTYHHADPRSAEGMKAVLSKVPWETVYEETGLPQRPRHTLFQLGAESARRLKRASHLLPIADGFNYLLSGVPRVELSQASTTQLCNPVTRAWSERLLEALHLPPKLLPPLVPPGTELGPLKPEIAKEMGLDDTRVITSCSHELAAALAGLPVNEGESWAYVRPGRSTLLGLQLGQPLVNEAARELEFANELTYGGSVCLYKQTAGLSILEECQRVWTESNRDLDGDLLSHLAGSAEPFESLINPADPRFLTPGDMPQKIQEFCKETDQPVPRKPGPIYRCILESLTLLYRKTFQELEYLAGSQTARLCIFGDRSNSLLNHFITNALQLPVVVASPDAAAIGNAVVQALALGHIKSPDQAREILRGSFKMGAITPHASLWDAPYDRFVELVSA